MRKMKIGKSSIEASVIALGTWAVGGGSWWGDGDDTVAIDAIRKAVEQGITLIDTAPCYGFGHSETIVGKALKGMDAAVSTKCGLVWDGRDGSYFFERDGKTVLRNVSPESIRSEIETSLERLQKDYIDIYFTHWQSVEPCFTPIASTMDELMNLKAKGKIKSIGASNVSAQNIEEYVKHGQLDIIQEKYSLLDRRVESELVPACKQYGITLQAYTPLEQGALTGKLGKDFVPDKDSHREGMAWFQPEIWPRVVDMVDGWEGLCEKYGCSKAQLAVAWLFAQGDFINVLCGARKAEHILDNIEGEKVCLEANDAKLMRDMADEVIKRKK